MSIDDDIRELQEWFESDEGRASCTVTSLIIHSRDLMKCILTEGGEAEIARERESLLDIKERIDRALFYTRPKLEAAE